MDLRLARDPDGVERVRVSSRYMQPTADFDPKTAAKTLMREARSGALATLMAGSGDPYCSLVNVATATDGTPLLLISQLALHTKNILADARVSLMLDERKEGDPLQGARVMLMGLAAKTESADARRRYLAHQPEAEMFAGFGDFAFYEVKLKGAHLVAGFGRIVDLKPDRSAHRSRWRRSARGRRAGGDRAHERRSCRDLPALRDQASAAPPTAIGAASAAIRRASICNASAWACGCRSRSA